MGTNTIINRVLGTDASIQLQAHPYIHHVSWIEMCGGIYDHSIADYIHTRLTFIYPTAPEKKPLKDQQKI